MAVIAGKGGSCRIIAVATGEVESWSLNIDGGLVDSHSLGDDWGETTQTIKKWTGTVNVRYDKADTNQAALQVALLAGSVVTDLRLYTDGTNYYTGNAKVSSMSIDDPVEDLLTATFEVMGEGALTTGP